MSQTKPKAGQFFGIVGHGTDGYFLMTNGDGTMSWSQASTGPSITSVDYPGDDTAADPAGGQTVVLTGTGFATSGMSVTIGGTTAPSVSHTSNTQLTITTPAKTAGDYDIVVTNGTTGASGTFVNGISYNGIPTWTTATGSLGTFESETTISTITLQATEPDGGTITFNITSGALPSGLSLTGANIDGTTTAESSTTLYSFTIEAIDDENQATPRNFSITVNSAEIVSSENFTINTYTGNGSTQSIEGKIGTAASFNGSSSYITAGDWGIQGGAAHTVSFWVNFKSTAAQFVYGIGDTVTSFTHTSLRFDTSLTRAYLDNNGGAYIYSTSLSLSTGTWYYITHTYDGSGTSELFIDGVSVGSQSVTLNIDGTAVIGRRPYYGSDYLNAKLDQFRVFNKELSSSEITTLYGESNTSSTKSTTDIFDDGSGVALYEFEKGAIDTGGGSGYIGSGGIFDGSSSYIDLGNNSSNNNPTCSVSLWFNTNGHSSTATLINNGGANSGATGYFLGLTSSGYIRLNVTGVGSVDGSVNYADGEWHHVIMVLDNGSYNVYIDGNTTPVLSGSGATTSTATRPAWVGKFSHATANIEYWDGKIDQIRIFNRAITTSEVTTLYGETSASATKSTTDIFDDGSGVALYELEGNANDTGDYPYGTGDIDSGQSASLNGSSSKIDFAGPLTGITNNFSYSFWANSTTSSTNFIGIASNISSGTNRVLFNFNEGGNYFFDFGNISSGGRINGTTPASWFDGNWHHFVVVKTPTSQLIYVDGAEFRNVTGQNSSVSGLTDFTIGNYTSNYTSGKIDQVRVYSTALSASDVEALASETNVPTSNLVAHYKLDGNANDETTNYNGTWGGTEAYSDPAEYPFIQYNGTATNVTYAYDGTPTNVGFVGTAFQPDFVWIKGRTIASNHALFDSVRGTQKRLEPDTTGAEDAAYTYFSSFDSNGFTLSGNQAAVNGSYDYVAWCFKGGGADVLNEEGSIDSQVSANQDAGFSIVSYTGNGTASTIGHGLSQAPEMIIAKSRSVAQNWAVYHKDAGNQYWLQLNGTTAKIDEPIWNDTTPTDSVFSMNGNGVINANGSTNIAYCFHSVDGYQRVGSYTGDSSTNRIIYTTDDGTSTGSGGFSPRWVLIKAYQSSFSGTNWRVYDSIRGDDLWLRANGNNIETSQSSFEFDSSVTNGFRITDNRGDLNESGDKFIYLAIA